MAYRRIQVLIAPDQDDVLEFQARMQGRSKSDLIREAVAARWASEETPADDPYLLLDPVDGPDDGRTVSTDVDRYLYETEVAGWRRS